MSEFLPIDEAVDLEDEKLRDYLQFIYDKIEVLNQQAEKNCGDCYYKITTDDAVVIDLQLDDWRECRNHCDECTMENQVDMCQTQLEIIDFLASEILAVQRNIRAVARLALNDKEIEIFDKSADDHKDRMVS